eukprot:COSAG01_NODE_380_length_17862_cov_20.427212_19_plen_73_part_00
MITHGRCDTIPVRRYHASRGHHTLHSYVVREEDYEGVVVHASFAESACGVADAFVYPRPLRPQYFVARTDVA